ncbi:hypothetical protein [Defluviitalea raffinosedens]|uniref:hypothetical protein n=1 Tax=Defluviitalea raffinosedens TaxID=1450156 RepID=UPI00195E1683|nr:hypothetical protein [Defluviitalea raffinosedens]MBM7687161.1 hypothetical protein [Defluviitalea raffinosedens]
MNSYYRNWPYSHMPNYKVQNPYPFYNTMATGYHENLYESSSDSFEEAMMRQRPQDINRIMALVNRQFENYYIELQSYGVPRIVTSNIFRSIVAYVLENENKYTGNLDQRTNALFNAYLRDNVIVFIILRGYGVPSNRINQMIRTIIRFVLENIGEQPATGWSEWEDLGGVLTSAPAVASWQPNRLDVFGRGQNNALWHKWWDGSRWSEWEDLGGGVITSGPGAASTASNRLEVFARGANNQLLFRTWNGITWSGWRSLGGEITSEPAAVSWGGNRLDVFARGLNNHLWHIWRL